MFLEQKLTYGKCSKIITSESLRVVTKGSSYTLIWIWGMERVVTGSLGMHTSWNLIRKGKNYSLPPLDSLRRIERWSYFLVGHRGALIPVGRTVLFQHYGNDKYDPSGLLQDDVRAVCSDNQILTGHYTCCALLETIQEQCWPQGPYNLWEVYFLYDNRRKGACVSWSKEGRLLRILINNAEKFRQEKKK